ncbi:MAG: acetylglutamate kinase [Planctomycetota bacterium]|jgi:acetylglutamate kinase
MTIEQSARPKSSSRDRLTLTFGDDLDQRTAILKVGGANLNREPYIQGLANHVRSLVDDGMRVVVVHGGGAEIGALHEALDVPFRKIDGLRVTSESGMELTTQILCGSVNKRIVASFQEQGLRTLGLSGIDLGLLHAELVDEKRLGRVGKVTRVAVGTLRGLLDAGIVCVLAPVSTGPDGRPVNVNADAAAHAVATAIHAERLDFVSDIQGVRTRVDCDEVAGRLCLAEARELVHDKQVVQGGMRPKLEAAVFAVEGGVGRVRVGSLSSIAAGLATEITA